MLRNILIIPHNNINMPHNILIMPRNILIMPLNILIMPCNILNMLRNILIAPLCREGYFILPYNEVAIAQGPKIQQKNEL